MLKIQHVLFWSYYGPVHLDQNRTIRRRPEDVLCCLGTMFFIIEEAKETALDFSKGTVIIYFVLI